MACFFVISFCVPEIFKFSFYANLVTETSLVVQVQW